jgi:cell fate regulator YaaT (PSP1 superfamily)
MILIKTDMGDKYILVKTGADENFANAKINNSDFLSLEKDKFKFVLLETEWGQEVCKIVNLCPKSNKNIHPDNGNYKFIRFFANDDQDLKVYLINAKKKQTESFKLFSDLILSNGLDTSGMKPVKVHLTYDQKKMIFYYIAPDRVDFRKLLNELISKSSYIVRLQQISPRSAAMILGGVGICGNVFCCHRFLPVLAKVDKDIFGSQGIADNNKEKYKGPCGRLHCCLTFEKENYKEAAKNLPKIGSRVKIKDKWAEVISKNILNEEITVQLENGERLVVKLKDISKK